MNFVESLAIITAISDQTLFHWFALRKGRIKKSLPRDPRGYLIKFNTGRLRPEVQPLTLLYTILAERVSFYIPFWQKRYPFYIPVIKKRYPFYTPILEHRTPFLNPCNEVDEQDYGRISSISRRNVKQTTSLVGGSQDTLDIRRTNRECFCFATFIKPFQCLLYLYMYILFNAG